jgi:hypothetical protein
MRISFTALIREEAEGGYSVLCRSWVLQVREKR